LGSAPGSALGPGVKRAEQVRAATRVRIRVEITAKVITATRVRIRVKITAKVRTAMTVRIVIQGFLLGHDQSDDQSDGRSEGQSEGNWSPKSTRAFLRAKARTMVTKSGEGIGSGLG